MTSKPINWKEIGEKFSKYFNEMSDEEFDRLLKKAEENAKQEHAELQAIWSEMINKAKAEAEQNENKDDTREN